jgi:hypothetical protein
MRVSVQWFTRIRGGIYKGGRAPPLFVRLGLFLGRRHYACFRIVRN